ncbi:ketopantoate reductase family protein [Thermodesulfobacteriota bacterium]
MNILVVGPGAMGCLFAARLKIAGYKVALFDHNTERVEVLNSRGIMVEGVTGEYSVNVPAVSEEAFFRPYFVIICVKSTNTEEAARSVKQWISPQSIVVTLQNGIGNLEILRDIFGQNKVLGGVTAEGATVLDWGRIKHAGQGATVIGPGKTPDSPAEKLASAFRQAGFDTRAEDNKHIILPNKTNPGNTGKAFFQDWCRIYTNP